MSMLWNVLVVLAMAGATGFFVWFVADAGRSRRAYIDELKKRRGVWVSLDGDGNIVRVDTLAHPQGGTK